VSPLVVG